VNSLAVINGREFTNNAVHNFLNKNDIKLVKGSPYTPLS